MPTVLDATVVNSAYDTSGNGGRKLVRLSNGTFIEGMLDTVPVNKDIKLYKSTLGTDQSLLATFSTAGGTSKGSLFALASHSVNIHVLYCTGSVMRFTTYKEDGTIVNNALQVDTGQSAIDSCSLAINSLGTELHASWASKNATYPNSFNIRYAKGTINGDGSVTWGAVEQWTTANTSGIDYKNPSISYANTKPVVTVEEISSGAYGIVALSTSGMANSSVNPFAKPWTRIYNGSTYAQSSPSAIFVPQSVNGLANGRIEVLWSGADSVSAAKNLRISYSDDGGATWSTMQKLTDFVWTANGVSLTANKNNQKFIVTSFYDGSFNQIYTLENLSGTWSTATKITNTNSSTGALNPSALFDSTFNLNFSKPLYIYQNNSAGKVGFYGTWTVTTISVTQGSIGQKTDKANVLTYAITTDGTMSTITEKVNGVTVGTKTATSGQSQIVGLSQAQWDAVINGKYKDVTGGLNTLTIQMGSETFTYTFDKRPATDADMISVAKAVQDSANVSTPAKKALLASAIRAKGGTVNDTDVLEVMASAVGTMPVSKKASGTGTTNTSNVLTVTGLSFKPSTITIRDTTLTTTYNLVATYTSKDVLGTNYDVHFGVDNANNIVQNVFVVNNSGFVFTGNAPFGSKTYKWIAYE